MELIKKYLKHIKLNIRKYPYIVKQYRSIRDLIGLLKKEKLSIYGFLWKGNKFVLDGSFEPTEIKIVSFFLKYIDLVINVGANQGFYTCISLSKSKKVFAFEPDPLNYKYLIENIKINNWSHNVEAYPMAVSNKNGLLKLYGNSTAASLIPGWGGTSTDSYKLIPSIKLDNLIFDQITNKSILIIVDIEGAEKSMLEGAQKLLNLRIKPIWLIEISIDEHQPNGIQINPNLISTFEIFLKNDYKVYTADKDITEIKVQEIRKIYRQKKNTLKFHNFIFLDKSYPKEVLKKLRSYLSNK